MKRIVARLTAALALLGIASWLPAQETVTISCGIAIRTCLDPWETRSRYSLPRCDERDRELELLQAGERGERHSVLALTDLFEVTDSLVLKSDIAALMLRWGVEDVRFIGFFERELADALSIPEFSYDAILELPDGGAPTDPRSFAGWCRRAGAKPLDVADYIQRLVDSLEVHDPRAIALLRRLVATAPSFLAEPAASLLVDLVSAAALSDIQALGERLPGLRSSLLGLLGDIEGPRARQLIESWTE